MIVLEIITMGQSMEQLGTKVPATIMPPKEILKPSNVYTLMELMTMLSSLTLQPHFKSFFLNNTVKQQLVGQSTSKKCISCVQRPSMNLSLGLYVT